MSASPFPPFEDSRRLTGPNLHFAEPAAVLESLGSPPDATCIEAWRTNVERACAQLDWPPPQLDARRHATGVALAFTAPFDQLLCATEVNEWAWLKALLATGWRFDAAFHAPGHASVWDDASAEHSLRRMAQAERDPALIALIEAAEARAVRVLVDDDTLSIGSGRAALIWPREQLPDPASIDWSAVHDIPTALVTGSNGKTTTVRLLAAMLRAQGLSTAWSCTDGLYADGVKLEAGDYSGPAGARAVLRHAQAEAAVLESARGGLLRRGLAPQRADVAVVTNISVDHFGEYGIHNLHDLAAAKLIVARAVPADHGWLVLNADDALLRQHAPQRERLAWFGLDHAAPHLVAYRSNGGASCALDGEVLRLHWEGVEHDLGAVSAMPLSAGGVARYNIANLAAAALAAAALGVTPACIATVLARFGREPADNPGRLQISSYRGATVLLDFAHNAEGLQGLLAVASVRRTPGARLGVLLGQAGNRQDAEIRELAGVVAAFQPDRIVLKDIAGYLRGRAAGEVAALLQRSLREAGVPEAAIETNLDEIDAAKTLLAWAKPGDVLVLPIHATAARVAIDLVLHDGHAASVD